MTGLDLLRIKHPWPPACPEMTEDWQGWFIRSTEQMLTSHLGPDVRLVVECGSWLGVSARAILKAAPAATLVAIDHWLGTPQMQAGKAAPEQMRRLPTLYEQFLRNLWPWRQRIVPLRADTLVGLIEVHAAGLTPDVVYLDSEHNFDRVFAEMTLCGHFWPKAVIVGDDYTMKSVRDAVARHAARTGQALQTNNTSFCLTP